MIITTGLILRNVKFYLLKNRKKRRVMFFQALFINLFSTILYELAKITLTLNDYYTIKEYISQVLVILVFIGIFSYLNKAILSNRMAILLGLGANINYSVLQDLYKYLF
jgi:uncharacterized membrane protein (DUF373 family)